MKVEYQKHKDFVVYRQKSGWNEQGIMMTELNALNEKMANENRKVALCMDHAPCHLISNQPIPNFSNIKIVYIGRNMTDKLQPLDHNIIAVVKNIYKKWLNLELYKTENTPSRFEKIKKITEILYSLRPEIGKYCWDKTIFKGNEEPKKPEEIIIAKEEIAEERMLKLTDGCDQMHINDDDEEDEEQECVELEVAEDARPKKVKVQSTIESFFTAKKK